MKFNDLYNKIISEMVYINSPNASYKINDSVFNPIIYKDICICASALNPDLKHVINRLKKRTNNKYDINTIIEIIKRYINKDIDLSNLFKNDNKRYCSCSIQSTEFNLITVQVVFEKNLARDIFSTGIENCKYFCFIHTILSKNMTADSRDKELLVESNNILYVN